MKTFIELLERKIDGCDALGGLEREKAVYQSVLKDYKKQLTLTDVGSSLPDLAECNQASLDYATKKDNPDFFLIKQTFKEGINWALNYMTKNK
tara:strand:+ start:336 stop:614 length:279 start_codon:yes stop_codon:yes gene_type:complete